MGYSWPSGLQSGSHGFAASTDVPLVPVSTRRMTAGALHAVARLTAAATVAIIVVQIAMGINTSSPFHSDSRQEVCLNSSYLALALFLNRVVGDSFQIK